MQLYHIYINFPYKNIHAMLKREQTQTDFYRRHTPWRVSRPTPFHKNDSVNIRVPSSRGSCLVDGSRRSDIFSLCGQPHVYQIITCAIRVRPYTSRTAICMSYAVTCNCVHLFTGRQAWSENILSSHNIKTKK